MGSKGGLFRKKKKKKAPQQKKTDSKYTVRSINKRRKPNRSAFGKKHYDRKDPKNSSIASAWNKAKERGQKLFELQDKSERMRDTACTYNDLSKQLANKSWFG